LTAKRLENSNWERLVADRRGRILATVEYRLGPEHLAIRGLAVEPNSQRQGIARQILDALAGIARAEGLLTLSLHTIRETGNVGVFFRLGFTAVSEEVATWCVSDNFATLHETYMEKRFA
jgi:GNAT superfamily N-acetyltransferase